MEPQKSLNLRKFKFVKYTKLVRIRIDQGMARSREHRRTLQHLIHSKLSKTETEVGSNTSDKRAKNKTGLFKGCILFEGGDHYEC